jgi:hypothetical protein
MNTPTPRTDALNLAWKAYTDLHTNEEPITFDEHARELERELTESRSWRDEAMLRLNNPLRHVIVENDLLRKMVDAFAECDCGDKWLMADYRELPHVRARKAK